MKPGLADLDSEACEAWNEQEIAGYDAARRHADDMVVLDQDAIVALAALTPLEYDRVREAKAAELGCRIGTLDRAVERRRRSSTRQEHLQGTALALPEPEPWPEPVAGDVMLSDLSRGVRRYLFIPKESADAVALWIVFTYLVDVFKISPRLCITAAEKNCGKSVLLDLVKQTSWRPVSTASIQPAGLFRVIEAYGPTLLIDEAENMLKDRYDLLGILNTGHRHGIGVIRCEGDSNEPRAFDVFGACALALIGTLPDTLDSRSIKIEMRRAKQDEAAQLRRFDPDKVPDLDELARKARRWAEDNRQSIRDAEPDLGALFNRDADNWRPLIAIADAAGDPWPTLARASAAFCCKSNDRESLRTLLLSDIRDILSQRQNPPKVSSAALAADLASVEGRSWAEWGRAGKPMTATALAKLLAPFRIFPATERDGAEVFKGYKYEQFIDAFERYLPCQTVTPLQSQETSAQPARSQPLQAEAVLRFGSAQKPNNDAVCNGVTVQQSICRQCGAGGDDLIERSDGVRLHRECARFYKPGC